MRCSPIQRKMIIALLELILEKGAVIAIMSSTHIEARTSKFVIVEDAGNWTDDNWRDLIYEKKNFWEVHFCQIILPITARSQIKEILSNMQLRQKNYFENKT